MTVSGEKGSGGHGRLASRLELIYDEDPIGSLDAKLLVGDEYCFFIYVFQTVISNMYGRDDDIFAGYRSATSRPPR